MQRILWAFIILVSLPAYAYVLGSITVRTQIVVQPDLENGLTESEVATKKANEICHDVLKLTRTTSNFSAVIDGSRIVLNVTCEGNLNDVTALKIQHITTAALPKVNTVTTLPKGFDPTEGDNEYDAVKPGNPCDSETGVCPKGEGTK